MLTPRMAGLSRHPQRGFTLVEALVTVLIFGIGMLGVIGLQTLALASSGISNQRNVATTLALDMADRMRGNLAAVTGVPGTGYAAAAPASNGCRAVYAASVGAPAVCSSDQLAADDRFDWRSEIQQVLPSGDGVVCIDRTPDDGLPGAPACDGLGNAYAVKVWWTQRATQTEAQTVMRFALTVRP